jgi:putative ABC transport system permease protein
MAGRLWQAPFEATLGATVAAATGLKVGDRFVGSHGLVAGGAPHAEHPYTVVGVLAPTASVLDRLVLTPVESVWAVHGMQRRNPFLSPADPGLGTEADREVQPGRPAPVRPLEVTALLIHYSSPLGAVEVPLEVNRDGVLQAASPALETARLLSLVGVGLETLRGFGLLLIASAGLSVFIALWNAMQERRYDLAVMYREREPQTPRSRKAGSRQASELRSEWRHLGTLHAPVRRSARLPWRHGNPALTRFSSAACLS